MKNDTTPVTKFRELDNGKVSAMRDIGEAEIYSPEGGNIVNPVSRRRGHEGDGPGDDGALHELVEVSASSQYAHGYRS